MLAFATLFFLTAVTSLSALCLAIRMRPSGRAELLLTTTLAWNAIVLLPIYVLGMADRLYATTVGPAALLVAITVLAMAARGVGVRRLLQEARSALPGLARLPLDAAALAWRARSLAWVGVIAVMALIAWTTITAYFAPPCIHYDSTWYHDSIVGFTLQNHGFKFVDLPGNLVRVNCYPHVCEMTQLWFVLFTDRRLIEVANCLLAPSLVAGVFLLCRRFTRQTTTALGLACAFLFVPAAMIQLQSTAVDLHTALLLIAALHYTIRSPFRVRDAWLTGIALVLAIGSKYITIIPVAVIGLCAAARLIANHGRHRRRAVAWTLASVFVLVCTMGGITYARNFVYYGNPVYPHIVNERWPGGIEKGQVRGGFGVDLNMPMSQLFDQLTAPPTASTAEGMPAMSYGMGVPFILLPLVLIALFFAMGELVRAWAARQVGAPVAEHRWRDLVALGTLSVVSFATLYTSPARWGARYNLMSVAVGMALVAWLCAHRNLRRLGEGVTAIMILGGLMTAWWREPLFLTRPSHIWRLVSIPFPEREVALERGPTGKEFGPVRESLLGDGEILAFNDRYGMFPSLFWNSRFSNRILYVPSSPDFIAQAEAAGARWIFCENGEPYCEAARAAGAPWDAVGHASVESVGQVYHRRLPTPNPP
jgi:Na+-transporting methylmalonyl-CoA/oxaloacetate decarboxylase gamma subunit